MGIKKIKLTREVKVGDILTSLTIIISLISVLISWSIDRDLHRTEEVNKIRQSAAETFAKLERAKEIYLSIFDIAQQHYVETSELAVKEFPTNFQTLSTVKARDYLWKNLNMIRYNIKKVWFDEKIDTGYKQLFSYYPVIRKIYRQTINNMQNLESAMFQELLTQTEKDIMTFVKNKRKSQTALLGNRLRNTSLSIQSEYTEKMNGMLEETLNFLTEILEASDRNLYLRKQP